jgi:peptidyl-prolyl cis-trans isomerase D
MLSLFRSKNAKWFVLGLLSIVMIAFVITGIGTPAGFDQLSGNQDRVAKIGDQSVYADDIAKRMQTELDIARQQNPQADMVGLVRSGGLDAIMEQTISAKALEAFALAEGMSVSKRSIDAKIAAISAFAGPTGSFDRDTFLRVLADRKMTESGVRKDIATDILTQRMIIPLGGAAKMPASVVTPYASLLLEARSGHVGVVPNELVASGKPPTDTELQTFYTRNALRYTVPETRVIRYALFDQSRFNGKVTPSDAEIAQYYKANAATYAPSETRSFSQVIVQDQAKAQAIAAKVKMGSTIAAAASEAGLSANKIENKTKKEFAGLTSDAIAAAAFSAAKGGVVDASKSGLGWHVVQVDGVTATGGRSLEAAKAEIVTKLADRKVQDALADFVTTLEDSAADGASFDDIVKQNSLQVVTMPAITSGGIAPSKPGFKAPAEIQPILSDAFKADANDEPPVLSMGQGKGYGFYDLQTVNAAAPKPLTEIKDIVVRDFMDDRAAKAARKLAEAIVAKASGKMTLDQALATAGINLPPSRPVNARRLDIAQAQGKAPPALALLFSLAPGKAKLIEAEGRNGWYIVKVDKIERGDASKRPDLVAATQSEMTPVIADEYLAQFVNAAKANVGFKKNDDAVKRLRKTLTGSTGQ